MFFWFPKAPSHLKRIRWCHLHWLEIWPPGGGTCIRYKLGHQGAPLASIENWVTKWHHLHWFKIWSSGGATCIGSKVVHQVESPVDPTPNVPSRRNISEYFEKTTFKVLFYIAWNDPLLVNFNWWHWELGCKQPKTGSSPHFSCFGRQLICYNLIFCFYLIFCYNLIICYNLIFCFNLI